MPIPTSVSKSEFRFSSLVDGSDSDEEVDDQNVTQRRRQVVPRSSNAILNAAKALVVGVKQGVINALLGLERNASQHPKAHYQDLQIQQLLLQFDQLKADNRIRESMSRAQSNRPPDITIFSLSFQFWIQNYILLKTSYGLVRSYLPYYEEKPTMYLMAMEFARDAAGRALIDGSKSVDVCQAYLLMAVYPVPKKKWAEDRSWLLMGVAIRMAIELELNQPPPNTCSEREKLNRTRTWLNCYCVDGSHAIQFGKMPMLRLDDYLARHSREWYKMPMGLPYDVHLCAYVHIIIVVAEFRAIMAKEAESPDLDVVALVLKTEAKLSQELSEWVQIYAQEFYYLRESKRQPK
ncbi:hypothetical protein DXG01_014553 [Tephrocybe rancida]|nr:hypothetical protein DXG01_014553 [Tephrocybe rancida]